MGLCDRPWSRGVRECRRKERARRWMSIRMENSDGEMSGTQGLETGYSNMRINLKRRRRGLEGLYVWYLTRGTRIVRSTLRPACLCLSTVRRHSNAHSHMSRTSERLLALQQTPIDA